MKEPFDVVRWSFVLVAAVIMSQVIMVAAAGFVCMFQYGEAIVLGGKTCGQPGALAEVLAAALAAALGFAGGRISGK